MDILCYEGRICIFMDNVISQFEVFLIHTFTYVFVLQVGNPKPKNIIYIF